MTNRSAKSRMRRGGNLTITLRLPAKPSAKVLRWAAAQPSKPNPAEAVLHLVEIGLRHEMPPKRRSKKSKAKASRMAHLAIDRVADQSATAGQRAARRRRLIQGPKEFRTVRAD